MRLERTLFADKSPLVLLCHQKYPIVWQGLLALKNDTAAVQLHFVCGNKALAHRSLPLQEGGTLLRIVQRMRLEASQLESVARRMTVRPCLSLVTSLIYIKQMVFNALAFFFLNRGTVTSVFYLLCHAGEIKTTSSTRLKLSSLHSSTICKQSWLQV